jgi:TorA maturation chaperone TorD
LPFAENNLALVTNFTKIYKQMKKLIAVLTLFLAFAFSANAQQDKKASIEEAAKLDTQKLAAVVTLKGTQEADFTRLFMMKHKAFTSPELTAAKKAEIVSVMDAKIRATLDGNEMQKLDAKPEVLSTLTGADFSPKK